MDEVLRLEWFIKQHFLTWKIAKNFNFGGLFSKCKGSVDYIFDATVVWSGQLEPFKVYISLYV